MTKRNDALARVMLALTSRPERWLLEDYEFDLGDGRKRRGYRFYIKGMIEIDGEHARAIDPELES